MRANSSSATSAPIGATFWRMTVSGGSTMSASGKSSKPTSAISRRRAHAGAAREPPRWPASSAPRRSPSGGSSRVEQAAISPARRVLGRTQPGRSSREVDRARVPRRGVGLAEAASRAAAVWIVARSPRSAMRRWPWARRWLDRHARATAGVVDGDRVGVDAVGARGRRTPRAGRCAARRRGSPGARSAGMSSRPSTRRAHQARRPAPARGRAPRPGSRRATATSRSRAASSRPRSRLAEKLLLTSWSSAPTMPRAAVGRAAGCSRPGCAGSRAGRRRARRASRDVGRDARPRG